MQSNRIAILGVVRNGAAELVQTLRTIGRLGQTLNITQIILVTNDNEDDTDKVLQDFAQDDPRVQLISLDGLIHSVSARVDRIAMTRNFALQALLGANDPPEFTMMMDMDGPNTDLSATDIQAVLDTTTPHWDGVFANQPAAYYDIFALRHPDWCPADCWQEIRAAKFHPLRRHRTARVKLVHDRQYAIPENSPWIEVESAFGGLALYRTKALRGCWYGSRGPQGRDICEHVLLHRQMRAQGARLFLAPGLRNIAPAEHLGRASGQPFPADKIGQTL